MDENDASSCSGATPRPLTKTPASAAAPRANYVIGLARAFFQMIVAFVGSVVGVARRAGLRAGFRRLGAALASTGGFLVVMALLSATPASAAGSSLLNDPFTTSSVSDAWTFPSGNIGTPCLTAGTTTSGQIINDCTSTGGSSGVLQLTNNTGGQVGALYSGTILPTVNGLDATWTDYQYDSTSQPNSADGMSFQLAAVDPSGGTAPTSVGQPGGGLGYASSGSASGVPHGYLGFGSDVYGGFEGSGYGGSTCTGGSSSTVPESFTVRGPGNGTSGYCLISGATTQLSSPYTLDDFGATSFTGIGVPEEVVVNTTANAVTASASGFSVPSGDWMFAIKPLKSDATTGTTWSDLEGTLPTNPVGTPSTWLSSGVPEDLAFGFAASTGGSYEYHQLSNMTVANLQAAPTLAITNTVNGASSGAVAGSGTAASVKLTASVPSTSPSSETSPVTVTDTFPSQFTPTAARPNLRLI